MTYNIRRLRKRHIVGLHFFKSLALRTQWFCHILDIHLFFEEMHYSVNLAVVHLCKTVCNEYNKNTNERQNRLSFLKQACAFYPGLWRRGLMRGPWTGGGGREREREMWSGINIQLWRSSPAFAGEPRPDTRDMSLFSKVSLGVCLVIGVCSCPPVVQSSSVLRGTHDEL